MRLVIQHNQVPFRNLETIQFFNGSFGIKDIFIDYKGRSSRFRGRSANFQFLPLPPNLPYCSIFAENVVKIFV
jgi:hypothetical protein